jgi:hypothetical protein
MHFALGDVYFSGLSVPLATPKHSCCTHNVDADDDEDDGEIDFPKLSSGFGFLLGGEDEDVAAAAVAADLFIEFSMPSSTSSSSSFLGHFEDLRTRRMKCKFRVVLNMLLKFVDCNFAILSLFTEMLQW